MINSPIATLFRRMLAMKAAILVAVALSACSAFNLSDANKLQKGMGTEEVLALVSHGPETEFDIEIPSEPNAPYHVMVFDLKMGGITAEYYAVFKNARLLYWGHPYEFNRYPDPTLNEIGKAAVTKYGS